MWDHAVFDKFNKSTVDKDKILPTFVLLKFNVRIYRWERDFWY